MTLVYNAHSFIEIGLKFRFCGRCYLNILMNIIRRHHTEDRDMSPIWCQSSMLLLRGPTCPCSNPAPTPENLVLRKTAFETIDSDYIFAYSLQVGHARGAVPCNKIR